ncbi:hypothetical protein R1flu_001843 [Riccia fluitans]|uniref:C2 domain-containing protein n=1 Tax=Riccia fluitans TaxID=41844 RepID=A0ABD1Y4E9_9MARC
MLVPVVGAHEGSSYFDSTGDKVFGHGVLHVEIFKARGIKGDEIREIGNADPYLEVKHGNAAIRETLKCPPHPDGGSNPVWNFRFSFPLRNGGARDHNILEIEIYNKNKHTSFFRPDNSLGHVRLGGLAEWITKHEHWITEPAWYPVFYKHHRSSKDQTEGEKQGEILVKFYFQKVEPQEFALGQYNHPTCVKMDNSESALNHSGNIKQVKYTRVVVAAMVGIAQAVILSAGF